MGGIAIVKFRLDFAGALTLRETSDLQSSHFANIKVDGGLWATEVEVPFSRTFSFPTKQESRKAKFSGIPRIPKLYSRENGKNRQNP